MIRTKMRAGWSLGLCFHLPPLLQVVVEPHRVEYLHGVAGGLVGADAVERVDLVPEGHKLGEAADEFGEEPLDVVHHLVEGEVRDGDVAEVPVVLPAAALDFCQLGQDLLLPVELGRLLGEGAGGGGVAAVHLADEGDDAVLDVVLALELVQPDAVAHAAAQQRQPVRLPHQVLDDPVLPCHHEVPVLEEGQPPDDPVLRLRPFVRLPLLGGEEAVPVGQLQVLAQQTAHLRLRPHSKVADSHAVHLALGVHRNNIKKLLYIFSDRVIKPKQANTVKEKNIQYKQHYINKCRDSKPASLAVQKKKNSLLLGGYSGAFFLKSRLSSMKGSLGSSSRNSKFLKNLSSQDDITSGRNGLLFCLSHPEKDSSSREKLRRERGVLTYSAIGEAGTTYSLMMAGTSMSKASIILRFLGWRRFLFFISRSGLNSFTQARRMPTFSSRLLAKSKLQNSPSRSWQQQSSNDFLETPTARAASERLIFFMPDLTLDRWRARHCLTNSIDSPIVLYLLLSFLSRPSSNPDSTPLSDSVFCVSSSRRLNRTMMICVSSRFLGTFPLLSAPNLLRGTKELASGSQMETLLSLSGQYCAKRAERSTVSQNKLILISNSKD